MPENKLDNVSFAARPRTTPSTPADASHPTGLIPQLTIMKYTVPKNIMILPTLSNNGNNFLLTVLLLFEEYQLNNSKNMLNIALAQMRIAKVFKNPVITKIILPKFNKDNENRIPKNNKL